MARRLESSPLSIDTIERKKNLVASLVEAMEREITEGRLRPGDRLPSEAALAASAGVSRTVVREAVAALKAAKLVEARQGSGAFVLPPRPPAVPPANLRKATVEEILSILELRMAIEVEAAALAATRRTEADIAALDSAIAEMSGGPGIDEKSVKSDLLFHRALAASTKNHHFGEFLDHLGEMAMPRRHLSLAAVDASDLDGYLALVDSEHRAIRDAIVARDPTLASAIMRSHLAGSRARYAGLINAGATANTSET